MNEKTISIIETLIAVCKEGVEGFQLAANEVRTSGLQSLFQGYSLQRSRFVRELEGAASALRESVSAETGAVGRTVARTWMTAGDAGTARDEQAVLAECERGADAAVAAYTMALEETELPPAVRAMIAAQAIDVKAAHEEVHGRRNRFAPAAQT